MPRMLAPPLPPGCPWSGFTPPNVDWCEEELCAWIKLKAGATSTEDQIRDFCRAKLAYFKVPRYVKFVEAFPQTVTGKIQKFKIRDLMKEELGLAEQKTA